MQTRNSDVSLPSVARNCSLRTKGSALAADDKTSVYMSLYRSKEEFLRQFSVSSIGKMLMEYGKEEAIVNDFFPSLTMAARTFGEGSVKTLLMSYIFDHCSVCSITAERSQVERIAEDIILEYGYLKISEVALFFRMLRSGHFRNGDNDRAKMFGSLSGQVINDCLYQFRSGYRSEVLEAHHNARVKREKENEETRMATYQEKYEIFTAKCLQDPEFLDLIKENEWLMSKEIRKIETYIEEFRHLRLLRTRVAEYIGKVNEGADPKTNMKVLEKANDFLNEKYPIQTD